MPTFHFYFQGKLDNQFSGADENGMRMYTQQLDRKAEAADVEVSLGALEAFYKEHDPTKLENVDEIYEKYPAYKLIAILKKKYGKDYLTKQEWARRNGMWKGAISRPPYAKQTCQRRTAAEPPACALQVPRPGNSSPGRGWARPSPVYKEMRCRSWRRPMISSCSFAFAYDTVSVTGLLRMPR